MIEYAQMGTMLGILVADAFLIYELRMLRKSLGGVESEIRMNTQTITHIGSVVEGEIGRVAEKMSQSFWTRLWASLGSK